MLIETGSGVVSASSIQKHRLRFVDTMDAMKWLEDELACEAVVQQMMN